jgi:hypothetical protein
VLRQNQLSGFGASRKSLGDPWLWQAFINNPLLREEAIHYVEANTWLFPITTTKIRDTDEGYWPLDGTGLQLYWTATNISDSDRDVMFNSTDGVYEAYLMRTGAYVGTTPVILVPGLFYLYWDSNTSLLHLVDSGDFTASVSDPLPLNTLVHLAVTKDSDANETSVWIDGVRVLNKAGVGGVYNDAAIWFADRGWTNGVVGPACPFRYYGGRLTMRNAELGLRYPVDTTAFTPPALPFPETL